MSIVADLHVYPTPEEAVRAAALLVRDLSAASIQERSRFTVALSGGGTPRPLYQLLASPPFVEEIDWARWHVFWGDERCVPPVHPDSNYRMAAEALLDHVPITASQVHRIRGEAEPNEAAREYEHAIQDVLEATAPSLDLVLLGIGDDGHTASLFPGTKALAERERLVVANWVPHFNTHRITFTLPLINAARRVVALAIDAGKADAVRRALAPGLGDQAPPIALVHPKDSRVQWFLAESAARLLTS